MFTINNVSNRINIRSNESYAVKPAVDYLEQAQKHLKEYKKRSSDKIHFLDSARVLYGAAIRMAETEWRSDPLDQKKGVVA